MIATYDPVAKRLVVTVRDSEKIHVSQSAPDVVTYFDNRGFLVEIVMDDVDLHTIPIITNDGVQEYAT